MEHDDSILGKAVFKALEQGWDGGGLKVDAPIPMIIYNHDFCKAVFGTDWTIFPNTDWNDEAWKIHLASMAISDDPIAYLGSHL